MVCWRSVAAALVVAGVVAGVPVAAGIDSGFPRAIAGPYEVPGVRSSAPNGEVVPGAAFGEGLPRVLIILGLATAAMIVTARSRPGQRASESDGAAALSGGYGSMEPGSAK